MDEVENPEVTAAGQTAPTKDGVEASSNDSGALAGGTERIDFTSRAKDERASNNEPLYDAIESGFLDIGMQYPAPSAPPPALEVGGTIKPALPKDRIALPTRPILKREGSAPTPAPNGPPPFPGESPSDAPGDSPDSLTLADLRRIREGLPMLQAPKPQELASIEDVYAYEYKDVEGFQVEIEEWFAYNDKEVSKILALYSAFDRQWDAYLDAKQGDESPTVEASEADETDALESNTFWRTLLQVLDDPDSSDFPDGISALCYFVLGSWNETAGRSRQNPFEQLYTSATAAPVTDTRAPAGAQIWELIDKAIKLIEAGALEKLRKIMVTLCERDLEASLLATAGDPDAPRQYDEAEVSLDLWACLTMINVIFEVARLPGDTSKSKSVRELAAAAAPEYLNSLTNIIARLRWDESAPVPISKVFTLHWKAILLAFGGTKQVDAVKQQFKDCEDEKDVRGQPVITASPLDYHLFRQEISSKYPAYQPPKPLFPIEPDNNSILPPLRNRQSRYDSNRPPMGQTSAVSGQSSIMHQPVHIATPAPSPPPSPAGPGGKGGKKQNYQTNQMFPFLYPPLDNTSNDIGGKGSTELQDALAGKKWRGSDVPTSILEAAELFAKRMRATRAMKQMWQARVDFMKHDRGWKVDTISKDERLPELEQLLDIDDFDLDKDATTEAVKGCIVSDEVTDTSDDDPSPLPEVGRYYRQSLPHLQSFVIVALKVVLKHITDLVAINGGRTGPGGGPVDGVSHALPSRTADESANNHTEATLSEQLDHIDTTRVQEITCKALTGSILLMLKWFKVSHILRYEYLTQLLLDSNFIPLVLKLWQTQDIGRAVHHKLNQPERNFFNMCVQMSPSRGDSSGDGSPSRRSDEQPGSPSASSPDSAAPPPISFRHRRNSSAASAPAQRSSSNPTSPTSDSSGSTTTHPPEIDELGYPTTALPTSPLTRYSWRNVTTFINYLRILQKLTRRKAHRSLLLVSYKSGPHLKKSLRVPIAPLRYYTLKLFKSQVPYCGRKWRQSNMKVITAVWLSVPAELRDDWLVGGGGGMGGAGPGDVDGTVEEALPLEQSLRALTHWWNCATYPVEMGLDAKAGVERLGAGPAGEGGQGVGASGRDMDFFERELERMEELGLGTGRSGGGDEGSAVGTEDGEEEWSALVDGYN